MTFRTLKYAFLTMFSLSASAVDVDQILQNNMNSNEFRNIIDVFSEVALLRGYCNSGDELINAVREYGEMKLSTFISRVEASTSNKKLPEHEVSYIYGYLKAYVRGVENTATLNWLHFKQLNAAPLHDCENSIYIAGY